MSVSTKHRVLVVDDNRDAAISMGELLTVAGFEVETCFDGASALAAAQRFVPDACLLDIAMPGMDGYELAQQLRKRFPEHTPLLATMTAFGDYQHLERAADAGFDLQFTKPASPGEVIEQLKQGIRNGIPFAGCEPTEAADRKPILLRLLSSLTNLWSNASRGHADSREVAKQ